MRSGEYVLASGLSLSISSNHWLGPPSKEAYFGWLDGQIQHISKLSTHYSVDRHATKQARCARRAKCARAQDFLRKFAKSGKFKGPPFDL